MPLNYKLVSGATPLRHSGKDWGKGDELPSDGKALVDLINGDPRALKHLNIDEELRTNLAKTFDLPGGNLSLKPWEDEEGK